MSEAVTVISAVAQWDREVWQKFVFWVDNMLCGGPASRSMKQIGLKDEESGTRSKVKAKADTVAQEEAPASGGCCSMSKFCSWKRVVVEDGLAYGQLQEDGTENRGSPLPWQSSLGQWLLALLLFFVVAWNIVIVVQLLQYVYQAVYKSVAAVLVYDVASPPPAYATCAGGSLASCIDVCPIAPADTFETCVQSCRAAC